MTSDELWTAEIAALAQCDMAAAVEKFGGEAVWWHVKANGRLPSSPLDFYKGFARHAETVTDVVKGVVGALAAISDFWHGQPKPTRYERIQRRVAGRGPRRRKHNGRLAKLRRV